VEGDPEPRGGAARARQPERDGHAELGADRARRQEVPTDGRRQEAHDRVRHAERDRVVPLAQHAVGEHAARAPIGVEQLRAARRDVDEAELQLEQAHRPQRAAALVVGGEAAPARPRAIARGEREEQRHQVQRVDVVVVAHAIGAEEIDPAQAREEQRRARRDADHDEHAHRQQRRFETGPQGRRRHPRLGKDRDVEARAEVAPDRLVLDVVQRLAEQEEAERQAHEAQALHVADFVAPLAQRAREPSADRLRLSAHRASACGW